MKILVCISNVPDTTTKIRFTSESKKFDTTGVQWIINPWDELALTRALQLKEDPASQVEKIGVVTVGLAGAEPTLRKALAIGADDAIRINADPTDAYYVAGQIAASVKEKGFDILLCGIESSDYNGTSVGGMLAEFLEIPSVSAISSLRIENGKVQITRDIDGGKEELTLSLPFVGIVQKGIAKEPRIPAMRGIMMARQKPMEVIQPADIETLTVTSSFESLPPKKACKMIEPENIQELVSLLQNEAKVI
ncbi:MAG: electron transfer flavoprotein subunit alpha [Bacteroides sp. SM23_62_1]|nr:MAG: electron transfer flavoprotein subunit alpha [Bacteroides sp. SM23_62_1]